MSAPDLRKPVRQGGKGPGKRETQLMKTWLPEVGIDAEGLWPSGGVAYGQYDFATDGGAVGDIALGVTLPANAIITGITIEEATALTSGGSATVALKAGSTTVMAALAFDTGFLNVTQHTVAASIAKNTAAAALYVTIATAALTAGKLNVIVRYVVLP